jgi:hypothetical protein
LPRLALDDLTLDASSTVDTSNILLTSSYPAQLWPETALASRLAEEELAREESESKPAEEEVLEKTIGRVVAQLDEESGDGSGVKNSSWFPSLRPTWSRKRAWRSPKVLLSRKFLSKRGNSSTWQMV